MIRLTRSVRLFWDTATGRLSAAPAANLSLSVVPLGLQVTLESPETHHGGMLVNVSRIDRHVRELAGQFCSVGTDAFGILSWFCDALRRQTPQLFAGCELVHTKLEMDGRRLILGYSEVRQMVQLTTRYELAASHRLWQTELDAAANFELFGKCSNPGGHGHNYVLEVTLQGRCDNPSGRLVDTALLDRVVDEQIIERFDHKNLNDLCEFSDLVPTVENMAKVFWDRLIGQFGQAELVRLAIWETAKTCAEYFGPGAGPLRYTTNV